MVGQIRPTELQLNTENTSVNEASFLDVHLAITNDTFSAKFYDKRGDFDF